jgi:hypothetical protein
MLSLCGIDPHLDEVDKSFPTGVAGAVFSLRFAIRRQFAPSVETSTVYR